MLSKETIKAYNASRKNTDTSLLCYAPFGSMNFDQSGKVTACCYNRSHVYGRYPKETLHDIWFGKQVEQLQSHIKNADLSLGCNGCANQLVEGNFHNTRARVFDTLASFKSDRGILANKLGLNKWRPKPYPSILEFELHNICNLECVMCNGKYSSLIRKNREQLDPLEMVYDHAFVDQLDEFVPHLTDAKFLGGEPFLIPFYWQVWDRMKDLNPKIVLHITTNGTILSARVKKLMDQMKINFILSIDSFTAETYHKIRANGNFDKVWSNMNDFKAYCDHIKTYFSIAVCPMTLNWKELPEMVDYCNKNNIVIYFNTLRSPMKYSLYDLSAKEKGIVVQYLSDYRFSRPSKIAEDNLLAFNDLIQSLSITQPPEDNLTKQIRIGLEELKHHRDFDEFKGLVSYQEGFIFSSLDEAVFDLEEWVNEDREKTSITFLEYTKLLSSVVNANIHMEKIERLKSVLASLKMDELVGLMRVNIRYTISTLSQISADEIDIESLKKWIYSHQPTDETFDV